MPAALEPFDQRSDEAVEARSRSPHPYRRRGTTVGKHDDHATPSSTGSSPSEQDHRGAEDVKSHQAVWSAASESGTEADDEHGSRFLKALPPATYKPRKGLKDTQQDGGASPLLTPSQLDHDSQRLSQSYFEPLGTSKQHQHQEQGALEAERRKFETRRQAERVRRLAEGALLGYIGIVVACGPSVLNGVWQWHRELLSHVTIVGLLVAVYPLRLLSLRHKEGQVQLWNRFRVPASFDPASILYPTFLPVLVALSLVAHFPALLLPNLMLGLASLPPRLFQPSSRGFTLNALHWMVVLVPLIASENTEWPSKRSPIRPYALKTQDPAFLNSETLTLLYPIHELLLPPLHYLTTTSLLPAEKQLLATILINLLFFPQSPQIAILYSLLWTGGLCVLVTCFYVLRWNVALARVPNWRFRRSWQAGRYMDLSIKFPLLSTLSWSTKSQEPGSDADDDDTKAKPAVSKRIKPSQTLSFDGRLSQLTSTEPRSAIEAHFPALWNDDKTGSKPPRRRYTIATGNGPAAQLDGFAEPPPLKQTRPRRRDWSLGLTSAGATFRKWIYAIYVYVCIVGIIFGPVRHYVSLDALKGAEPIFWAIDYLFGDLLPLLDDLDLDLSSMQLSALVAYTSNTLESYTSAPALRLDIGPSNVRLLLILYWLLVLAVGLLAVLILTNSIEVDTRRKIFHAIMVAMLLPSTFVDPCFCALALALVLAVFLLLEVIRAGQVPPLGSAIGRFVAPYVDGRDLRGPVVVSHVFLLIGCAVPLWLSLASFERSETDVWAGWELDRDRREVAMVAGVVCVGMGDAAASLIGRRYGKRKWPWIGGKSLEGSAAFAAAVTVGLMAAKLWLRIGGWEEAQRATGGGGLASFMLDVAKAFLSGCGASFMEAVLTGANDNVVVPIALWLLVRGVDL